MSSSRVVAVDLRAEVRGFVVGIKQAQQSVKDLKSEVEKSAKDNSAQMTQVGVAFTGVGLAAAAAAGVAITKWATFDQAMSNVQAATHESAGAMKSLSDAALDAGARTVFSATEAAGAIEELAKAGVSTADILGGGLDGALDLAAAGGLGVAEAAGIAATALKTFGLEGRDMSHVADLLAAGAGKAMGDVTDLSSALNQSAMVANATGLSIEETTATLAAFASQGLLGSDAGTSFKSMLQSLTPTSAKARETMDQLGISAYDAQGNFIGMAEFAGKLQAGLKDLTVEQQQAALKTIFGSDAIRAATVLYSEGAEGINEWIDAVDDQGYAAETAAARLDNLMGDIEALGGALDTALIKTGSGANDVLRSMVQILTDAVDAYSQLPPEMQGVILAGTLLAAGVGLIGGAFLLAVPKIVEFNAAMAVLKADMPRVTGLLGAGAKAAGALAAAVAIAAATQWAYEASMKSGVKTQAELVNALTTSKDAVDSLVAAGARSEWSEFWHGDGFTGTLEDLGALFERTGDKANNFWVHAFTGTENQDIAALDSLERMGAALSEMASSNLPDATRAFSELVEAQKLTSDEAGVLLDRMPAFKDALTEQATEMGVAADDANLLSIAMGEIGPASAEATAASEENADALAQLEGKAAATEGAIDDLADAIRGFGSAELDARAANRELEASFDDLTASIVANGLTLDTTTEQGRANEAALDGIARATLDASAATLEQTGSQEQANAKLQAGRDQLIGMLAQFGITGAEADAYADRLGLIPTNLSTHAQVTGIAQAEIDLAWVARRREALIDIKTNGGAGSGALNWTPGGSTGGTVGSFAGGGTIPGLGGGVLDGTVYGRGTSKSDSVMVRLSKGEEVIQEPYATMNRTLLKQINSGMFRGYAGGGTVDGRYVQYAPPGVFAGGGGGSSAPTQVSLAGARFTFEVEGRPFTGIIREQIAEASSVAGSRVSRGTDRRF